MAELLILNFDTSNKDPEQDRLAWKKGHVIAVMEDGHKWGKEECLPKFHIIKLPDVKVEEVQKYMESKHDLFDKERRQIEIRKYKIDLSEVDIAAKSAREKDVITEKEGITKITSVEKLEEFVK